jgi:GWxTD domain-containing protein
MSFLKTSALLLLIVCFQSVQGQISPKGEIKCWFEINRYNTPSETPFVEVLLSVDASSLTFLEEDGMKNAGFDFTILFLQNDKVITYDKVDLLSPDIFLNDPENFNLIGMRRIVLPNGSYDVEITVKDLHNPDRKISYPPDSLHIFFEPGAVALSDFRLIDSVIKSPKEHIFKKNGLILYPHFINYYLAEARQLHFYAEIYNLDESYLDEDILVTYGIYPLHSEKPVMGLFSFTKIKGAAVNPILGSLQIKDLPRGKYRLMLEVRNRENHLITSKEMLFFRNSERESDLQKQSAGLNIDTTFAGRLPAAELDWYLNSLKPVASNLEAQAINTVLAKGDTLLMRQFFYYFWITRNLENPEKAWGRYRKRLIFVKNEFGIMNRRSYETDRGRVYLEYGEPDERFESKYETDANPYEIWRYNRTPFGETNVIFVFKATDLVSNNFELIHSNATGELKNQNWELIVRNAFNAAPGFDKQERPGTFGNSNDEIFKDQ